MISGITAASFSTAFAYIADVTPAEKRAAAFGMVGPGFGLGFTLGPALGGVLGGIDPRLPFWVAGALALANAAYGYFVLPESLPEEKRAAFSWKRANPVGSLRLLRSHRELYGIAAVLFLMQLAHVVFPAVTVLYMGYRYGWGRMAVGLVLAAVGVCSMIVQGGLSTRWSSASASGARWRRGSPSARSGWRSTAARDRLGIPVRHSGHGAVGACRALGAGDHEPARERFRTGRLQGASASLQAITGMIGPTLFTQVFAQSIAHGSGVHGPGRAVLSSPRRCWRWRADRVAGDASACRLAQRHHDLVAAQEGQRPRRVVARELRGARRAAAPARGTQARSSPVFSFTLSSPREAGEPHHGHALRRDLAQPHALVLRLRQRGQSCTAKASRSACGSGSPDGLGGHGRGHRDPLRRRLAWYAGPSSRPSRCPAPRTEALLPKM